MPRRVGIQQPKFAPSRWIGASMGNHDQSPYVGSVHRLSRGVSQFSRYSLHDLWSDDVRCMVRGTIRTVQLRSWGIRPAFQAKSQTLVDTFDGQIEFLTFLDRKPLNLEHLKTVQNLWTIQAYELCLKHSYHFHTHMFNNSLWFQARKEQPGRPQATHWGRKPQAIVKSTDFDLWNLWRVRFGYIIDQIIIRIVQPTKLSWQKSSSRSCLAMPWRRPGGFQSNWDTATAMWAWQNVAKTKSLLLLLLLLLLLF